MGSETTPFADIDRDLAGLDDIGHLWVPEIDSEMSNRFDFDLITDSFYEQNLDMNNWGETAGLALGNDDPNPFPFESSPQPSDPWMNDHSLYSADHIYDFDHLVRPLESTELATVGNHTHIFSDPVTAQSFQSTHDVIADAENSSAGSLQYNREEIEDPQHPLGAQPMDISNLTLLQDDASPKAPNDSHISSPDAASGGFEEWCCTRGISISQP
ncbi:hypothetical protein K490DRAFT_66640 [Saccharata proteae CBS 121410]|uniref:Uncharacterized protein n=1 Tax=Saccharata proteae CBS 121410 TaxID=1314787 RepID=A0A9P4LUE7_9PEZI|nr:hypothetical protein K490DRAFT_66640 [Saccharata proteae CBS 121410]